MVFQVLQCTLNAIVSPRRVLPRESHDGIHDDLSDSWATGLTFVTGIKLPGDELTMPSQDGIRREDGRDFPQSFAADGMSLHGEQATLVVVEQQSLFSELFEQGLDLSVLELDDLLLTLVHKAAEGGQHDVPWLEQKRHVRRRKSASVRCRRMKSRGRHEILWRRRDSVFYGVVSSAELFEPTADG